jgi:regulator of RNase E activity RraA
MTMRSHDDAPALTGKVAAEAVHILPARIGAGIIERYSALDDLTGTISDALDELGILGCVGASELKPRMEGKRIVGTAITVRNIAQVSQPYINASKHSSRLAEIEGHNQARPGDVLVIQGVPGVSNMGGISATIAKRQGEVGAIVDGGIRDVTWQRSIEFPMWSREVTPVTGKWRVKTVEINGPVTICGMTVNAGDLVAADDTGVCFVPADVAEAVVTRCEEIAAGEARRHEEIDGGMSVPELAGRTYVYQYGPTADESSNPGS